MFVNRVLRILKALWKFVLFETSLFWKIGEKTQKHSPPWELYHRFMHKSPYSDHSWLILNLPFKVIVQRFKLVFWCLERECCTFQMIDENSFKSTDTLPLLSGFELILPCKPKWNVIEIESDFMFMRFAI